LRNGSLGNTSLSGAQGFEVLIQFAAVVVAHSLAKAFGGPNHDIKNAGFVGI
jgi:hypothetical protein